jgi:allene oxide cyclase
VIYNRLIAIEPFAMARPKAAGCCSTISWEAMPMSAINRVLLAVVVAAGASLVFVDSVSADNMKAMHLIVVERATSDTVTDVGAKGDSVGDILTFANKVYDRSNKTEVGHDNGWCVRTVVGQAWECFWTLILDKGQITVEGPFYDAKDSVLAVTGGTGAYAAMRGDMKLHARNEKGSEYDFAYNLLTASAFAQNASTGATQDDREVTALNLLVAKGYRDFKTVRANGRNFIVDAVHGGKNVTVTINPDTGQISEGI